ncbi:excitatory amino acid transporter 2 isoform X3 [Osmia lignaria lignaria]|uniref:excitatory amino acid transporter 2 isoform X3 n=1 Tax=Osmia lignaria lignaria TaxID=1437193 RepID=UPI00402B6216
MEEKSSARFSDYLFAKMDGQDVSASQGPRKVTADTRKFIRENLLLVVTLSGVMFGVLLGFGLRPLNLGDDAVMLISYPGELFMRLLKLMILPLVIASLISGSASLNARMNGMIAVRTLVYFILTSLLNAVLGVVLVLLIHPGNPGIRKSMTTSHSGRAVNILDSLLDLGRNMFPDNIFQAAFQQAHTVYVPKTQPFRNLSDSMSNDVMGEVELMRVTQYRSGTNTLGIVFFCLVFGTFLGTLGEKGQIVIDFFKAVFEVIMRMVSTVMWMTPVGITSVIAGKILGVTDLALVMSQLAWFIVTIVVGVFFYQLVIMQLIYLAFVRKNPFKFYAGLAQGTLTAFAMASTQPRRGFARPYSCPTFQKTIHSVQRFPTFKHFGTGTIRPVEILDFQLIFSLSPVVLASSSLWNAVESFSPVDSVPIPLRDLYVFLSVARGESSSLPMRKREREKERERERGMQFRMALRMRILPVISDNHELSVNFHSNL